MSYPSSNGYPSLQHVIPSVHMLKGCLKSDSFHEIWELFWQKKWHNVDHKGLTVYVVWSSFNHHNTSKEDWYESIKQQWISLLAWHHPSFYDEPVPKIWQLAHNLRVVFGIYDIMWTMTGSYMVSIAPPAVTIHMTKVMKHSSSNGCLSLQYIIPFPVLRECPKSDILHEIWELFLSEMTWCGP